MRADANSVIGTGHVMRCLALAQAWQDAGGKVAFATTDLPESLIQRLWTERCDVHGFESAPVSSREANDIQETLRIANVVRPQWLVLDGYDLGPSYQLALRDSRWRLMSIDDDWRHERYHVDLLLNQNAGATSALYASRKVSGRLLLGCQYALLRREFRKQLQPEPRGGGRTIAKFLITLGGADQKNDTSRLIRICRGCLPADCEIHVLVGPANPHVHSLRETCEKLAQLSRERGEKMPQVVLHVAPPDVRTIMAACDLALTAAGSSVYELGFLGIPMLLVVTAENQRAIAAALDSMGAAVWIDESSVHTARGVMSVISAAVQNPTILSQCAKRFQALVDGQGAARVVAALRGEGEA
ncbi:MAG TPA: UDP-2,4-diacetamido-2,4,6-trideoxy-beta-L-altropyranose hydrolase [Planctomycetaceae bacterium]|nr:UDP-2,4-diacetamido-2,4,6-trideoxy-beta-L-altropyranose hydrolase [Planctomycetaceae bacterium]